MKLPIAIRRPSQQGFSLTEVLVAGVVGGVIITTVAGMNNLSQTTILASKQREQVEAAVNSDIDTIRQKMVTYTWCAGQGSITPSDNVNQCPRGLDQLSDRYKRDYYFPNQNIPGPNNSPGDLDRFKAACQDDSTSNGNGNGNGNQANSFLSGLITSIESQTLPDSSGVTRTVTISDGRAKRVLITYSGASLNRSLLMTPTVAAWCP